MKLWGFENVWAKAALGAMFPGSHENGLTGIGAMDVSGYLDEVMRMHPYRAAVGLRVAIWLVAIAPIVVLGRVTTIEGLPQGDRVRLLEKLLASSTYSVRLLVMLLKAFGALLYAGDAGVRARLRPVKPRTQLVSLRLRGTPR